MRGLTVADLMTRDVIALPAATPFTRVVASLADHRLGSLPVVDDRQHLLGAVSECDLLVKEGWRGAVAAPPFLAGGRRRNRWGKARGTNAGEVMTRRVMTVRADAALAPIARRLVKAKLGRLYVVDGHGRLIGVLARRDVLSVFLRPDDDLRADVQAEVGGLVSVHVTNGEVMLGGIAPRRSDGHRSAGLVEVMPGVVAVYNDIDFVTDDLVMD